MVHRLTFKYTTSGSRAPNSENACEYLDGTLVMEVTPSGADGSLNYTDKYLRFGPSSLSDSLSAAWMSFQPQADFYEPQYGDCGVEGGPSCYLGDRDTSQTLRYA